MNLWAFLTVTRFAPAISAVLPSAASCLCYPCLRDLAIPPTRIAAGWGKSGSSLLFNPLDLCAQFAELLIDLFIAAVDLADIADGGDPIRG